MGLYAPTPSKTSATNNFVGWVALAAALKQCWDPPTQTQTHTYARDLDVTRVPHIVSACICVCV